MPRIHEAFPVKIWTVDIDGDKLETETVVENLSASGLCVRLPRQIEVGEDILAFVRFTEEDVPADSWPRIAASGKVVRSKRTAAGDWSTAVGFDRHMVL